MADINWQEFSAEAFDEAIKGGQSFVSLTGALGIAGFVFDVSDDDEVLLENDITDHYTEANVPVQDNIVNRPVRVTLRGLVGEYVYRPPKDMNWFQKASNKLQDVTKKLITVSAFLPPLNDYTQQVFNTLNANKNSELGAGDWIDLGVGAFKTYRNLNLPTDKQSSAFLYFEALWKAKQTFTIQTPYRFYTNMAIESLRANQHGDTNDNSHFEVKFKQINKVQTNNIVSNLLQGRLKAQASNYINKGLARGKEAVVSTFKGLFGG